LDLNDPMLPARPAELDIWYRSTDTATDRTISQAVFAWGTDGFLIGTAMLPHEGVSYAQAHVTLDTGVIDHTITFHRPFDLSDWILMHHESPFAGGGRSFGRCDAFDRSGALVASYSQDNMIRPMPQRG
jgi:acyl-CoA thioesterase II